MLRAIIVTCAPRLAATIATDFPIPLEPPVIWKNYNNVSIKYGQMRLYLKKTYHDMLIFHAFLAATRQYKFNYIDDNKKNKNGYYKID